MKPQKCSPQPTIQFGATPFTPKIDLTPTLLCAKPCAKLELLFFGSLKFRTDLSHM